MPPDFSISITLPTASRSAPGTAVWQCEETRPHHITSSVFGYLSACPVSKLGRPWALPSALSCIAHTHGSCGFSEEGCADVPWALESSSWNTCHIRILILSEEIWDQKDLQNGKRGWLLGVFLLWHFLWCSVLWTLMMKKFTFQIVLSVNRGIVWGTTRRNDTKPSRNTSVQWIHSISSSFLNDYTKADLAERQLFSFFVMDQARGPVKVSLSLPNSHYFVIFVLLRMAGKIKDHWAFHTFVIFSLSPGILAFSNFNL